MHNGCLGVKVKVLIFVLRVEVKLPEKYSAGWRSRYLVGLITRRSLVRVQPPQRYSLMEYTIFDILKLPKRPVRLGVRTPDFHSGNTSSILVRATFLVMSVV